MIYEVKGDIVKDKVYDIFCHQVNCQGVMGSGLAKQIRYAYPEVFNCYKNKCTNDKNLLGTIQHVLTSDYRICINMFAQDQYGRDKQYTDYTAFKKCLDEIAQKIMPLSTVDKIAFPYMIGCGLAGGDWVIVRGMLQDFADKVKKDVYIVAKE